MKACYTIRSAIGSQMVLFLKLITISVNYQDYRVIKREVRHIEIA